MLDTKERLEFGRILFTSAGSNPLLLELGCNNDSTVELVSPRAEPKIPECRSMWCSPHHPCRYSQWTLMITKDDQLGDGCGEGFQDGGELGGHPYITYALRGRGSVRIGILRTGAYGGEGRGSRQMRTYASLRSMLVYQIVVGYNDIALLGRYSGGYTTRNTHYMLHIICLYSIIHSFIGCQRGK